MAHRLLKLGVVVEFAEQGNGIGGIWELRGPGSELSHRNDCNSPSSLLVQSIGEESGCLLVVDHVMEETVSSSLLCSQAIDFRHIKKLGNGTVSASNIVFLFETTDRRQTSRCCIVHGM